MEKVYSSYQFKALMLFVICGWMTMNQALGQINFNTTLLGQWDSPTVPAVGNLRYNDVWGYEAGGREYAIIGGTDGNYILDITNAAVPVLVSKLTGSCTSTKWRDHVTYQNYLYTITDNCATGGLQIWDLSPLPAAPVLVYNSQAFFNNAHTLVVNPASGRLYVGGPDTQPNGILVLGLLGHPAAPTLVADFTLGAYTHDMYVHNDTLYSFFGNGGISSFDLVDINNAYQMGSIWAYPESGYAHSGCGIKNNKYLVWTDETAGKSMKVGEISDPWNITFKSLFKSALLGPTYTNSIAHNPVAVGNLLYVSYYEDGLQIYDVSTPTAPVLVGYYDTNLNTTYNGFVGAWGIHPPLSSGKILVSDTQNGLFILQHNTGFPVNLLRFEATAMQDQVRLNWSTATEINNESFVIERSADGEHFEDLLQNPGAGNSNIQLDYSATDNHPLRGISYYRLRQVDLNGNITLSNVISVDLRNGGPEMAAFPNPAHIGEQLHVAVQSQVNADAQLSMYDMVGKLIYQANTSLAAGSNGFDLETHQLAAGSYLLKVDGAGFNLQQKVLLVK